MNTRKAGKRDQGANSIGAAIRFKHSDLPMLYDRLRSYGYNSLDALVRDFIAGKFPPPQKPESAPDLDYLRVKIRKIMALTGNAGLLAKVALLAGLRAEEALYIHRAEICDISGCDCHKLHIADGSNIRQDGLSIIVVNWLRGDGKRCYFAILPTRLWQCFRDLLSLDSSDVENAEKIVKESIGIDFEQLRAFFFQVIQYSTMTASALTVLNGKAGFETARDCRMHDLGSIADNYCRAWEKFGLVLPVI
jgi:hypothetical protein